MSSAYPQAGPSGSPTTSTEAGQQRLDQALPSAPATPGAIGHGYPSAESSADAAPPLGFDEGILRHLCDIDCGLPLLLERIKQTTTSASLVASFLRKRAAIEEEYARGLQKLSASTLQTYSLSASNVRAGSFLTSFQTLVRTHDAIADNRLRFALQCTEMADALNDVVREVDRSRKTGKEVGTRLEKTLVEAEGSTEKARNRFDTASEDLERLLLSKAGESASTGTLQAAHANAREDRNDAGPKRTFGKAMLAGKFKSATLSKNPAAVHKLEEDLRQRMAKESDGYAREVATTQQLRQDYFNRERPRILRGLKESADETDLGTQYHLTRYAHLFEAVLCQDGIIVSPVTFDEGPGLRSSVDGIDNRDDFKTFMQAFTVAFLQSGARVPRREGPEEDGYPRASTSTTGATSNATATSPRTATSPQTRPTYGVDLNEQMTRDGVEVPRILEKCAEAIESNALDMTGIYRLSGTTSRIQRLKAKLDRDVEAVNLMSDDNLSDVNDITGALKSWFRELPEPLMTYTLYHGFVDAAKIENDRLRHIRLHERVNDLPDANYATLKYLMGHLDTVQRHGAQNQMHASNLAIVFGPTLFRPPPGEEGASLADMQWQCKAIETILRHYEAIFVEAAEE